MNDFYEKQNEPHMLKLLAGQREIYSEVKAILMKGFCWGSYPINTIINFLCNEFLSKLYGPMDENTSYDLRISILHY